MCVWLGSSWDRLGIVPVVFCPVPAAQKLGREQIAGDRLAEVVPF